MTAERLTNRESKILTATVEDFIHTANPVPSSRVSEVYRVPLSTASIRNTMAGLERDGYLFHPHTSSGKVPTDKGYRTYVADLMVVEDLNYIDRAIIHQTLHDLSGSIDRHLQALSQLLSQISGGVGIAIAPDLMDAILEGIRLVQISHSRILFVLELDSGNCRTVVAELDQEGQIDQLPIVEDILRERLCGLALNEIQSTLGPRLQDIPQDDLGVIGFIHENSQALFCAPSSGDLHIFGLEQTLKNPEFTDRANIVALMSLVEDESRLISVLASHISEDITVMIGAEHSDERLSTLATIKLNVRGARTCGTLAVVAPKRVKYSKIFSALNQIGCFIRQL
ncbi:MAG: heat-inducible transcription repressor HrcA [Candidatus Marinimicrobia bacterium]|nr:heat-inducible transcription repressor HrcA [Candidatus Neomarinimicrobiota bacterium]